MIKIENGYFETIRAVGRLSDVNHISWAHHKDDMYEVKLHFKHDFVYQKTDKKTLENLKLFFKREETENIEEKERPSIQASIGSLFIEDGIVELERKWVADLAKVEFISYRQNWDDHTYFTKLHIGAKAPKVILETEEEVNDLVEVWKQYR